MQARGKKLIAVVSVLVGGVAAAVVLRTVACVEAPEEEADEEVATETQQNIVSGRCVGYCQEHSVDPDNPNTYTIDSTGQKVAKIECSGWDASNGTWDGWCYYGPTTSCDLLGRYFADRMHLCVDKDCTNSTGAMSTFQIVYKVDEHQEAGYCDAGVGLAGTVDDIAIRALVGETAAFRDKDSGQKLAAFKHPSVLQLQGSTKPTCKKTEWKGTWEHDKFKGNTNADVWDLAGCTAPPGQPGAGMTLPVPQWAETHTKGPALKPVMQQPGMSSPFACAMGVIGFGAAMVALYLEPPAWLVVPIIGEAAGAGTDLGGCVAAGTETPPEESWEPLGVFPTPQDYSDYPQSYPDGTTASQYHGTETITYKGCERTVSGIFVHKGHALFCGYSSLWGLDCSSSGDFAQGTMWRAEVGGNPWKVIYSEPCSEPKSKGGIDSMKECIRTTEVGSGGGFYCATDWTPPQCVHHCMNPDDPEKKTLVYSMSEDPNMQLPEGAHPKRKLRCRTCNSHGDPQWNPQHCAHSYNAGATDIGDTCRYDPPASEGDAGAPEPEPSPDPGSGSGSGSGMP